MEICGPGTQEGASVIGAQEAVGRMRDMATASQVLPGTALLCLAIPVALPPLPHLNNNGCVYEAFNITPFVLLASQRVILEEGRLL